MLERKNEISLKIYLQCAIKYFERAFLEFGHYCSQQAI